MRVRDFDMKEGVSLGQVEKTLRKLRVAKEIQKNEDTLAMFQQINKFLQDEDSINKLIYLLPTCRGGGILSIGQGLFSNSVEIERCATEILFKLEKTEAGKALMTQMNFYFIMKYHHNLNLKFKLVSL